MPTSSIFRALALGAVLAAAGQPATPKAAEPVDLELVLAIDVSRSVDHEEARLQRQGYIAAFVDPRVIGAIRSGFLGRIAVAYFEWAGFGHNKIIVDWTVIEDEAGARAFAAKLAKVPIESARRTSISGAIDFAVPLFTANEFAGGRWVIDISGDGANNLGRLVTAARDAAVAAGITINGLPIVNDRPSIFGWPSLPDLDLYYVNCVIGGPGAFIVVAEGINDFASAILRKLILEIAGTDFAERFPVAAARPGDLGYRAALGYPAAAPGGPAIQLPAKSSHLKWPVLHRVPPPCDIGERRFRDLIDDY